MGVIGLLITTVCYLIAMIDCYRGGDRAMSLVFFAYALANVGMILVVRRIEQ